MLPNVLQLETMYLDSQYAQQELKVFQILCILKGGQTPRGQTVKLLTLKSSCGNNHVCTHHQVRPKQGGAQQYRSTDPHVNMAVREISQIVMVSISKIQSTRYRGAEIAILFTDVLCRGAEK